MYPQVFSAAKEVDQAFLIILGFSVFILVAVTATMLFFLWRYHHKRHPNAADIKGSVWLEIVWTGLPTIIVLGLFWTGWTSFQAMRTIPEGAMEVQVEGRMWSWLFTYENGKSAPELVVPVNTPIKLNLKARDVIHSFYIPAMRVKWDMVPGMDTEVWFESDKTGEFDIFCAEYCGLKHADMLAVLRVVEQGTFDIWINETKKSGQQGLKLMEEYGCFDCHSMDGSEDVAPTLMNLAGKELLVIRPDGTEAKVTADEAYIKQSIMEPGALLVKDWDDDMPSFAGEMSKDDLDFIAQYLMTGGEGHPGEKLADEEGCLACHTTTGEDDVGPTFKGLFGETRTVTNEAGESKTVKIDEKYLREAITNPSAWIPEGYDDGMPPYDDIDEETLEGLIKYLKSLGKGDG
ncbi:cytochrome c oxidase subunit II [Pseudodesulfovibrio sp. zrk46]|uniref:cytochrome c oxidase subunit II n=1 Tax=Pseudodesulfovibrio sp. zrk46 TaxID=2725288 RepID=UPI001448E640|nr:cytochrome c oxidase subunit II [Pseudodesulfovibrio sp. zrk46]QJB56726.1 cytochrome c oxidase subunit II [Pseudodesulfovibrio sp. zrk46]